MSKLWHFENVCNIYNHLCDEQSKQVFDTRFEYLINGDSEIFLDLLIKEGSIRCPELDEYEQNRGKHDYILFGAGVEGRRTKKILENTGRNIKGWSDNNRTIWDKEVEGLQVIPPENLLKEHDNNVVIITARYHIAQVYGNLVTLGFPRENILVPQYNFIVGTSGRQYFDMFEPNENEVFMDVGCLNGETSKEFSDWCNGKYERIYAFEPDEICWPNCKKTFEKYQMKNVDFIPKGAWSKEDTLYFSGTGAGGSGIVNTNNAYCSIPVTSIDSILDGKRVTFIKMDIEGSEMEALIGAEQSIRKYKPRLAVCIYHKRDDLWTLADYILKLNPDYKLYMRHYCTCEWETVLYAV
jgi:FkbM family methyltransferase